MPSRKHKLYRKIDSEIVQGEGSWVLVKSPTLEDIRGSAVSADSNAKEQMDFGFTVMVKLIKDWNWVDDDGNELPKPTPEIVSNLPYGEISFLMDALELDKLTDQKN